MVWLTRLPITIAICSGQGLAITVVRNPIHSSRVSVKGNHSRHRPAILVEFLLKEITVATNPAIPVDFLLKEITVATNPAISVHFLLKEITVAMNPAIPVDFLSVKGHHSRHEPSNSSRLSVKGNHSRHEPSNFKYVYTKGCFPGNSIHLNNVHSFYTKRFRNFCNCTCNCPL